MADLDVRTRSPIGSVEEGQQCFAVDALVDLRTDLRACFGRHLDKLRMTSKRYGRIVERNQTSVFRLGTRRYWSCKERRLLLYS